MAEAGDVTQLLFAYRGGDREAFNRLVALMHDDLRRVARAHVNKGPAGSTLQPTALINEAYIRLVDYTQANYEDRAHFLSICARAMRNIVISNARKHSALKRGGGEQEVTFTDELGHPAGEADWLLSLDRALEKLGARDERLAQVVECRYFGGLTEDETAEAMKCSSRTVQRDWKRARAWLRLELGGDEDGSLGP